MAKKLKQWISWNEVNQVFSNLKYENDDYLLSIQHGMRTRQKLLFNAGYFSSKVFFSFLGLECFTRVAFFNLNETS